MYTTKISIKLFFASALLFLFSCSKETEPIGPISKAEFEPQFIGLNGAEVPNQYIIQLDLNALPVPLPGISNKESENIRSGFSSIAKTLGINPRIIYVYSNSIKGLAVEMSKEEAAILKASPIITLMENNKIVSIEDGFEIVEKHGKKPKKKDGVEANAKGGGKGKPDKGDGGNDGGTDDGTDGGIDDGTDGGNDGGGKGNGKGGKGGKGDNTGGDTGGDDGSNDGGTDGNTGTDTTGQPAQIIPWGISRIGGTAPSLGSVAWILDSGIDSDHPDLNVDINRSRVFLSQVSGASIEDGDGHGTHVAGIIGAIDNSFGVVGVASNVSLVAIRVLDNNGNGTIADVIAGIDYVAGNATAGDVANLSLAGPISQSLDDAVIKAGTKGIIMVMAAGNYAEDANNYSPARANGTNLFTISAINSNDVFGYFSNYGSSVDYTAPGVEITSTWLNGEYSSISGTSMAAPHFAGLLLSTQNIKNGGTAINDSDGNPDIIATR